MPKPSTPARLRLGLHVAQPEVSVAPWFQEEVRRELEKRFGTEQVHEAGLRVDTTLDLDLQQTANHAVPRRRGSLRAPPRLDAAASRTSLNDGLSFDDYRHPDWAAQATTPATTCTSSSPACCPAKSSPAWETKQVVLMPDDWKWTGQRYADTFIRAWRRDLRPPDRHHGGQLPIAPPRAGLRRARRDDGHRQHHRRRAGHGRRPRLRALAVSTAPPRPNGKPAPASSPMSTPRPSKNGVSPDDLIVDGPVNFGGYTPHNYENDYKGTMTLISAFAESRNIPALKLAATRRHPQGHRRGPPLRRHVQHSRLSPRRAGRRRDHARGAGGLVLGLPQRRHPRAAAPYPQGLQCRRHHALGRSARGRKKSSASRPPAP